MKIDPEKRIYFLIAASLMGIVGLIYWQALPLPFISDDWWFVHDFQASNAVELLKLYFNLVGKIVYRPLAEGSMLLMYNLFGFESTPIRILGLLIHLLNSYLVVVIIGLILENKILGYVTGLVYASAIAIHLDLLTWAWISYYDLGASFFFFLSIWFYLRERTYSSAILFFVGCLFKESIIFLPALLFFYSFFQLEERNIKALFINVLKKLFPFIIFGAIVLGFKIWGSSSPSILGEDHPYFIDLIGRHLIDNPRSYIVWMFQALFPFFTPKFEIYKTILIVMLIFCLVSGQLLLWHKKKAREFRWISFLFIWSAIGFLPVYLLPNHTYRYYSTYSLPAFVALFFYLLDLFLTALKVRREVMIAVFAALAFIAVSGSVYQSSKIYSEGLHQSTFADGTNMLIRRAATVDLVMPQLKKDFPSIPPGFVVVLVNTDLGAFGAEYKGLRFLYNTDDIEVIPPSALSYENGDWFYSTPDSDPRYLDPSLVVVYELTEDEEIIRLDLDELLKSTYEP